MLFVWSADTAKLTFCMISWCCHILLCTIRLYSCTHAICLTSWYCYTPILYYQLIWPYSSSVRSDYMAVLLLCTRWWCYSPALYDLLIMLYSLWYDKPDIVVLLLCMISCNWWIMYPYDKLMEVNPVGYVQLIMLFSCFYVWRCILEQCVPLRISPNLCIYRLAVPSRIVSARLSSIFCWS
jgi:hypothetical protein